MITKIKGIETTSSYVNRKVDAWVDNCGLVNAHFIDRNSIIKLINDCIRQSKKMSKLYKTLNKH